MSGFVWQDVVLILRPALFPLGLLFLECAKQCCSMFLSYKSRGDCFKLERETSFLCLAFLNCKSSCLILIAGSVLCNSKSVISFEMYMMTDAMSWGAIARGEDENGLLETGDGICGQAEASDLGLFNFIPADRCLAGQIIHIRGEWGILTEGGDEHDLQTGSKEVTPFLISRSPTLPPPIWKR